MKMIEFIILGDQSSLVDPLMIVITVDVAQIYWLLWPHINDIITDQGLEEHCIANIMQFIVVILQFLLPSRRDSTNRHKQTADERFRDKRFLGFRKVVVVYNNTTELSKRILYSTFISENWHFSITFNFFQMIAFYND